MLAGYVQAVPMVSVWDIPIVQPQGCAVVECLSPHPVMAHREGLQDTVSIEAYHLPFQANGYVPFDQGDQVFDALRAAPLVSSQQALQSFRQVPPNDAPCL